MTFGLGKPGKNLPVKIEIVWPGGATQTVEKVTANQFLTIREGKGVISSEAIRFAGASAKQ